MAQSQFPFIKLVMVTGLGAMVVLLVLVVGWPRPSPPKTKLESSTPVAAHPSSAPAAHRTSTVPSSPPEDLVSDLQIDIAGVLQEGREREVRDRQEALARQAKSDSIAMNLHKLLHETPGAASLMLDWVDNGNAYIDSFRHHPRVRVLLDVASNGSPGAKTTLLTELIRRCQECLNLPDSIAQGKPWAPSAIGMGGAGSFPYLLTFVDEDASSLPVLVDLHKRHQDALKKHFKKDPSDKWMHSEHGLVLAFACEKFLNAHMDRPDLRSKLSTSQVELLRAFRAQQQEESWDLVNDQVIVMKFAQDFVSQEKGGDK